MEKLIELLNECKQNSYRFFADGKNLVYQNETDAYGEVHIAVLPDYKLISKQFGFIKWLVENDKIDLGLYREYMPNLGEDFSVESNIIMNLSIAIDPIGYLNYILK